MGQHLQTSPEAETDTKPSANDTNNEVQGTPGASQKLTNESPVSLLEPKDPNSPKLQKLITDYFPSLETQLARTPDSQERNNAELTEGDTNHETPETKTVQPSYLSVALRALRRDEKSQEEQADK